MSPDRTNNESSRPKRRNLSVLVKTVIQMMIATAVIIILALFLNRSISEPVLAERQKDQALFVSYSLERSISPLLIESNLAAVQRLVENTAAFRFIDRIQLYNDDMVIQASSDLSEIGRKEIHQRIQDVFEKNLLQKTTLAPKVNRIAIPVFGDRYNQKNHNAINWVLEVSLNTTYEDRILGSHLQQLTIQSLVMFAVLTTLILVILYRSIFTPFRKFLQATGEIAEGNYGHRIDHESHDELGEFASRFNRMVEEINQRDMKILDAKKSLWESSQRLELALQSIDAGLWDWDLAGDRLLCNDRYALMLGYEPHELPNSGGEMLKLVHPEDRQEFVKQIKRLIDGETTVFQFEYRMRSRLGKDKWIRITGKRVDHEENHKKTRIIGTHIDIDQRKISELELARYRETLEEMVAQRTKELEETQAELVNKALEAGRAQLSAMILHNIGNAMTPVGVQIDELAGDNFSRIHGYLEKSYHDLMQHRSQLSAYVNEQGRGREVFEFMGTLLRGFGEQRAENEKAVRKIRVAVDYVAEIISLQQSYASASTENRQHVDLNALLDDSLRMQESALEKRWIVVEKDYLKNLPPLVIDKNKLMQVVVNLIKNAYEAIDAKKQTDGPNRIKVRSFKESGQVGFEVIDSGIGLDPNTKGTVFEFGVSGKGSSGFGLYYCKIFAEANRGVLTLTSAGIGQGAKARMVFELSI